MKNAFSGIIYITLILILSGCQEKKQIADNIISINPNNAKNTVFLSELVDSISYIKLETNKNCIMGAVREIIIKKKYIYAVDQGQMIIFVFDKKGQFVSKLDKRGRGPGEYNRLGPVFVSDEEDFIEVFNFLGKDSRILKYSNIKFDLLDERSLSVPSANSCRKVGNTYYFSTQQIKNFVNGESTNADIITVNVDGKNKALFKKKIVTNGSTFSPFSESFTVNDKGELFVSLMYNNTFYKLSDTNAYPILTVDFGRYGIDNSIGFKSTREQEKYLEKHSEGLASFPVLNANNSNLLAFSYYFKQNSKNVLHHYINIKESNKVFHVRKIVNDMTKFPDKIYISSYFLAVNHEVMYEDFLVDIILPWYNLKEDEINVDEIGKVGINDNPIIMLMKLKK